jgi:hypothetical protein
VSWYCTSSTGGALGHHPHARVLVAHVAFGDVVPGLAVEGDLVGAQELVATAQGDVALDDGVVVLDVLHLVAVDLGRLVRARLRVADWRRGVGERRGGQGVGDRAQIPVVVVVVSGLGRQGHRDADRQREQAETSVHAAGPFRRNGR